ncbi:MAG: FAD-dependent oxidoreductase [Pseudomonadales bacterium]
MPAMNIAVIGAGMAGVTCARALAEAGLDVTLLEKSRGLGGRLATRRVDGAAASAWRFDHGAPSVAAADPAFLAHLRALPAAAQWQRPSAPGSDEWVGVPSQSRLVGELPDAVQVVTGTRITALARDAAGMWRLEGEAGAVPGPFAAVAVATPAPQAVELLPPGTLTGRLGTVAFDPCWALMVATRTPWPLPWSAAAGDIAGITADHHKPQRPAGPGLYVLHATAAWSARYLEDDAADVAAALLDRFRASIGNGVDVVHAQAHRWRYARVARALGEPCLVDAALGLGYGGDGCLGDGAEAAFLSGRALAARLAAALPRV